MNTYRLIELQGESSWDPAELLSSTFRWPCDWPLVQLSEFTVRLNPRSFINDGAAVITPGGIDIQYGGIQKRSLKYQGIAYQVGSDCQDLQPGDLLIPRNPEVPPVLIGTSQVGAIISDGFYALRPTEQLSSAFLWALFSCESGRTFRRLMTSSPFGVSASKLDEAKIPLPSIETQAQIETNLTEILTRLENVEVEATTTWWSTANLREIDWRLALATPEPEQLSAGIPLSDHSSVFSGKRVDRDTLMDSHKPGLLPVANGSVLSGRKRQRWTKQSVSNVTAFPGDILVAAVGDRANARVIEETMVIDQGILLVRPNHSERATKIAAYLNSRAGQAQRQILLSGAFTPRISVRDLGKVPIPNDLFDTEIVNAPLAPLTVELEELLWTS